MIFPCALCVFLFCFVPQESSQRFYKQRDEQAVEYVADGKVIGKEMRYAAETEELERDGPPEDASDWDSLSDRVRKARRLQKSLLQQHRGNSIQAELVVHTTASSKTNTKIERKKNAKNGNPVSHNYHSFMAFVHMQFDSLTILFVNLYIFIHSFVFCIVFLSRFAGYFGALAQNTLPIKVAKMH